MDLEMLLRQAYSWTKDHYLVCEDLQPLPLPDWAQTFIEYMEESDERFAKWVGHYENMVTELMTDFSLSDHNARAILARTTHLYLGDE